MLEGKYPIMLDGQLCGSVDVTKQGAMTVFDAKCRWCEGLLRLSVYGQDAEGYLGVMAPEENALRLRRSLSRAALRGFPEEIIEAGRAGMGKAGMTCVNGEEKKPTLERLDAMAPMPGGADTEHSGQAETRAEETAARGTKNGLEKEAMNALEAEAEGGEKKNSENCAKDAGGDDSSLPDGLCWYSSPDGVLVSFDGERSLVALPPGDGRIPPDIPGAHRFIEGKEYFVFTVRNGRVVK